MKQHQNVRSVVAVGWANGSIVNPTLMPRISWVAKSMQPNRHLSRLKLVANITKEFMNETTSDYALC
jgi:hypothetical protein